MLTTGVDMIAAGYDTQRIKSFEDQLLDRIQAMGGVESAAFARVTPVTYKTYSSAPVAVEGYETQARRAAGRRVRRSWSRVSRHHGDSADVRQRVHSRR